SVESFSPKSSKSAKKLHAFKDRPEEHASTSREHGGKVCSEPSTPATTSKKLKRSSSSLPPSTSRMSTLSKAPSTSASSTAGLPSSTTTATATFTAPSSPMIVTSSSLSSTTITSVSLKYGPS
ncbi:hypothetical protein NDU88_000900, partial [Pleurodeles waltl]